MTLKIFQSSKNSIKDENKENEEIKKIILNERPENFEKDLKLIKKWRKESWRRKEKNEIKIKKIIKLIEEFATLYEKPVKIITAYPGIITSRMSFYNPIMKTIILIGRPSIITALHELSHHLFGPDEITACRWSIWLFKETFPKAYEKLEWQGHTLIQKT